MLAALGVDPLFIGDVLRMLPPRGSSLGMARAAGARPDEERPATHCRSQRISIPSCDPSTCRKSETRVAGAPSSSSMSIVSESK